MAKTILRCPECKSLKVIKSGMKWSGRHQLQRYMCTNCGRMTVKPDIISRKPAKARTKAKTRK